MRKLIAAASFALTVALSPLPALADEQGTSVTFLSAPQLASDKTTIDRIQNYMTGLTTVVADFTQIAPDGSLSSGKFFMARPGHMRWQYNPPTPILMVADGKQLVFYDYELQQVTYVSLDSTLIGFLAEDPIRFDGPLVGITHMEKDAGTIRITLAMREKPNDGSLMLEFSDKPLLIRNMVVTDATNQVTTVALNNAQFGINLDKKLFIFNDPRKSRMNPKGAPQGH